MRVGQGFDAHRFEHGRVLVVGGVRIEGHDGLGGHSDADVLSHAIADALLGAGGLGDLGTQFPGDARWKGASSLEILAETRRLLDEASFEIVNVDATIVAQEPRLSPHREAMIRNVATALGLRSDQVSIKATTTDGMGFTGRGEGMAATAVALVRVA